MAAPDPAPALRLGLAPTLALAWTLSVEDPVPFLGPVLAANLLMLGPAPPPFARLARLFVVVMIVTLGVTWLGRSFGDTPEVLWLALLALTTACFARLTKAPQDIAALLALIVTALVTVLIQVSPDLAAVLPWLMAGDYLLACVVALLAHALLRGRAPIAMPAPALERPPDTVAGRAGLRALGKAVAMLAALGVAILLEDTSAVLIATTVTNVLRDPDPSAGRGFGRALVFANLWAALLALPVLAIAAMQPPLMVLLPAALAGALWLAAGLGQGGAAGARARIGFPVYLVLLGLLLPKAGESAGVLLADRLLTLALAVAYAVAVLALLWPRQPAPVASREAA